MDNTQKKLIYKAEPSINISFIAKEMPQIEKETNKSFVNSMPSKNFQKYEVIVDNEQLQKELKLIQWRSKTELPLVKILFYKILQKKLLNECSVVQVAIQNFTHSLYTLPKLGFYQILYLLKEALIGFQRLYDRFGGFEVAPKMILINKNNKCRVWINQNITLNFPSKRSKISQNQFMLKILKLFEEKCIRSILMMDLFEKLACSEKLIHAIQSLEMYMRSNRINLPNKLSVNFQPLPTNRQNTPKKVEDRAEKSFNKIKKQSFGGSQIKKIPKFILNLREERKRETSIDNKSIIDLTKKQRTLFRNHSQVKLLNKSVSMKKETNNPSQEKSNNSPISNISQASRNQKVSKGQIMSRASLRNLIKQNSQEYLNPFFAMTSRKTLQPPKRMPMRPNRQEETSFEPQEELSQSKANNLRVTIEDFRSYQVSSAKDLCSINSSQHTATTINQSSINESEMRSSQKLGQAQQNEETSIFEKNGWMRRVNNLTEDEFCRQMMTSQHEGADIFSSDFALQGENLTLLGTMGKTIKSSLTQQFI